MQYKDAKRFAGLNTDDAGEFLPPDDFTSAKNVRTLSSSEQHGSGNLETLQSEIPVPLLPDDIIMYYGDAIGGDFIYSGYAEVTIGTQVWMKKNWDAEYPGSRLYDDSEGNEAIYGRLYTHDQIMQSDFCPEGWRVPTEADWDALIAYLGGSAVAGGKMKNVGTALWESLNVGADDSSGFRAVPGGKFDAAYELLKLNGLFWVADDGCPLAPVILNASEITHESFVANWKTSDGATGYYLDVSESPTFASFMMGYEDKDVGNVLNSLVEDLEPFTTYYFRLRAYNEHCNSDYSLVGTLKTLSMLQDIDGNNYHTKIIGNKQWIIENFRATHYKNGDDITNITSATQWANGWVESISGNWKDTYGGLYNWYAVNTGKLAPTGWHVPTYAEFITLLTYLDSSIAGGYSEIAGGFLKEAGLSHWIEPNLGADNSSGFTALGGGARASDGSFEPLKTSNSFHSTDNYQTGGTYGLYLASDMAGAVGWSIGNEGPERHRKTGYSIRCLLDGVDPANPGTVTDIDGNVYSTVKIGTQVWMVSNLKTEHLNDGTDIPIVEDNTAWAALTSEAMCYYPKTGLVVDGAYCWYNNDSASYKEVYGALYNWLAVNHASELVYFEREGVEETGWRVPSLADWIDLMTFIGGEAIAGGLLKEMGLTHWLTPNTGAIDYVGFKGLPGGLRYDASNSGAFDLIQKIAYFWSTTVPTYNSLNAYFIGLLYQSLSVQKGDINKIYGLSVRCVRDLTTPPLDRSQIGDAEFRIIVRDGHLCWDQAITGLGFNGVEDQDWINLKMIP
jgi:uncharacterized protein (TIGR02145 family)